jgi:inosose dehydratase
MKAKLGIAPIAWSNDDLPELGGETPLATCLRESRAAGFSGVETGGKFPQTTPELRAVLAVHDLQLASGWYSGTVLDNELAAKQDKVMAQLSLFRDLGAPAWSMARLRARSRTCATRPWPLAAAWTRLKSAPMATS